jgi:TetR/AcrR family transcriptional regulator, ethionamide resistance regulator
MSSATQRSRHREQRETTRHEILAAADHFLRERPYRELSVDVVMADTGLTRTAFYRHFDDVTDLVLRLFADIGQELVEIGHRWSQSAGPNFPAPAQAGLTAIVDFFVRHGPLVRAIAEAAATDERIERAYQGSLDAFVAITARTLDRLVADGLIEVPDTDALARALTLMNEAYLLSEFGREPSGDPEIAIATLETVWLRVAGPDPRKR